MNDRELLELAAKAAGAKQTQWLRNPTWDLDDYAFLADFGDGLKPWMALHSGSDALRLAAKLSLHIEWRLDGRVAVSPRDKVEKIYIMESSREDRCANVRRAIVRAAAEIGSQMK